MVTIAVILTLSIVANVYLIIKVAFINKWQQGVNSLLGNYHNELGSALKLYRQLSDKINKIEYKP